MDTKTDEKAGKCPVVHGATNVGMRSNRDWWPNQLNLRILRQNSPSPIPWKDFNYAQEFKELDLKALQKDLTAPYDRQPRLVAGGFRPLRRLMIRMAWHAAGTYRIGDGRGAPRRPAAVRTLGSWPDQCEP